MYGIVMHSKISILKMVEAHLWGLNIGDAAPYYRLFRKYIPGTLFTVSRAIIINQATSSNTFVPLVVMVGICLNYLVHTTAFWMELASSRKQSVLIYWIEVKISSASLYMRRQKLTVLTQGWLSSHVLKTNSREGWFEKSILMSIHWFLPTSCKAVKDLTLT